MGITNCIVGLKRDGGGKMRNSMRKLVRGLLFLLRTKKYKHIKYIYTSNNSDVLIVSFSGFPGCGRKPTFNYMRTLQDVKANKLFLLDDFGYPNDLGSYYLGENGNWFLPQEISELIDKIVAKKNIMTKIMIGSSKGGTSALQYAIRCKAQYAIIGAPQYYIGNYLNTEELRPIMRSICGDTSEDTVARLNQLMSELIKENETLDKPTVFVHYSPQEHTYPEHIKDMIVDLQASGYPVKEDNDYSYTDHNDVAKFFPKILFNEVSRIVQKNS